MAKNLSGAQLKKLVLSSFEAERTGDVKKGQSLLHKDFQVVEMCEWFDGKNFKRVSGSKVKRLMHIAYQFKGRKYEFINVAIDAATQTVIVEFVESYPDQNSSIVYRTPQIAVCIVRDGKLYRTRHYLDPRIGIKGLPRQVIKKALE